MIDYIKYGCKLFAIFTVSLIVATDNALAQEEIEIEASIMANASSGWFAPYFIGSLNHGKVTQKNSALVDLSLSREIDMDSRFSIGFGVEALAGAASTNDYMRWDAPNGQWTENPQGPPPLWLQQLYVEAKYRQIFMTAGLKEHSPSLLNPELSSGDFIESGNARPIPELRGGFIDFVDIPLTNGWIQMQCQLAYGIMPDGKYMENHYNYYNYHLAKNSLYNYKFCYFRSNPDMPLMVTAGMQSAGMFGGSSEYYSEGGLIRKNEYRSNLHAFFNMLLPVFNSGETFVEGSNLGSWDFYAQYMLRNGDELCAYFQWPFEDGSSIARRNKLDGIWGIEYRSGTYSPIADVVIEYVDFRDQSGPIHFAPGDFNGPTITTEATGRDNYYNNGFYNSYANYGMSIGTPFMLSPIYNLNGFPGFECTRTQGVHIGVDGYLSDRFSYRMLFGYQRGLGTYDHPYNEPRTDTSAMLEGRYEISDNFSLKAAMAIDRGTLRGNNFGALVKLSYHGAIDKLSSR